MIPRIIHQVYGIFNDNKNWKEIQDFRISHEKTIVYCDQNNIQLKFWDLKMVEKLLNNEYPHYKQLWNDFKHHIQRADFCRYMILHNEGGIYVDMDIHPIRSIESLFDKEFFFVKWNKDKKNLPYNAILGTKGGTQFYQDIMLHCKDSTYEKQSMDIYHQWKGRLVFQTTGHFMLQRVLKKNNITERLNIISVCNLTKQICECPPNEEALFLDSNSSTWYNDK
jgi:mannosyltransferase OCH1-like enzyme